MFEKMLSYGGGLLIVSIAILVVPNVSLAQHGGGHGGGGFGGGGFRGGGGFSRGAGFHGGGGFGGGHFGGGEFHNYRPGYGIYGYSYPYYGSYGYDTYDPYYYDTYPDASPTYDSGYNGPYTASMPIEANSNAAVAPMPPPDNTAHVTVSVPADA